MTTIAGCEKARAEAPRRKLAAARRDLLNKIDAQIVALSRWNLQTDGQLPTFITFFAGSTKYKVRNNLPRLQAFRIAIARCSGWTGKHREHADDMRAEWKRNGLRATRVDERNGFAESVRETAEAEKNAESELKNAVWRMQQHREREERLKREALAACNDWENTRREVDKLTLTHKQAMIEASYARGEFAEFQAYIEGRKANHEQPE